MPRFTIRDLVWLVVVVVVGTAVFVMRSGRESDRRVVMRRASEQELEAIKARYRAAKGEFEWHVTHRHLAGTRWSVYDTCDAIERLAHASETNDLESLVKDLASALELAQYVESITLDKYEKNDEPLKAVHRVQYTRAEIELRLKQAEEDLTAARATR